MHFTHSSTRLIPPPPLLRPTGAAAPGFPGEWSTIRDALAEVLAAQPDYETKASYAEPFLQYGDYLMAGVEQLPGSSTAAAAAATAAGAHAHEGGEGEVDELYEELAMAQLQLQIQGALFTSLGFDLEGVLGAL